MFGRGGSSTRLTYACEVDDRAKQSPCSAAADRSHRRRVPYIYCALCRLSTMSACNFACMFMVSDHACSLWTSWRASTAKCSTRRRWPQHLSARAPKSDGQLFRLSACRRSRAPKLFGGLEMSFQRFHATWYVAAAGCSRPAARAECVREGLSMVCELYIPRACSRLMHF
jgi:hypothetical protein